MRRTDEVVQGEQGMIRLHGLFLEHVECRGGDFSAFEGFVDIVFIDDAPTRTIHNHDSVFHVSYGLGVDQRPGLIGQRGMNRDEIGPSEQFVQFHGLDSQLPRATRSQVGIIADHLHGQALRQLGDVGSDLPQPHKAESFVIQLRSHEFAFLPLTRLCRNDGLGNFTTHGHNHGDRVLRRRSRIPTGRIHHDDATPGGGFTINVVKARPGAPDDLETASGVNDVSRHLRAGPNDDPIILFDFFQKLFLGQLGFHVSTKPALFKNGNPSRR